jgi:hypothetical protein
MDFNIQALRDSVAELYRREHPAGAEDEEMVDDPPPADPTKVGDEEKRAQKGDNRPAEMPPQLTPANAMGANTAAMPPQTVSSMEVPQGTDGSQALPLRPREEAPNAQVTVPGMFTFRAQPEGLRPNAPVFTPQVLKKPCKSHWVTGNCFWAGNDRCSSSHVWCDAVRELPGFAEALAMSSLPEHTLKHLSKE